MSQLPPGVEPQPLPECALHGGMTVNKRGRYASTEDGYTADQMRAIEAKAAQAGYLAGLEAAANVCGGEDGWHLIDRHECAWAIRNLKCKQ